MLTTFCFNRSYLIYVVKTTQSPQPGVQARPRLIAVSRVGGGLAAVEELVGGKEAVQDPVAALASGLTFVTHLGFINKSVEPN